MWRKIQRSGKFSVIERIAVAAAPLAAAGAPAVAANVYRDGDGLLRELDMGSPFDHFGPVSWPDSRGVTPQQRANRALLQSLMTAQGFLPYAQEWWHFTLSGEPYPDTYFDFLSRRP